MSPELRDWLIWSVMVVIAVALFVYAWRTFRAPLEHDDERGESPKDW